VGGGRRYRRGGLVGPLLLIGLGVVALLDNLGVLTLSIWEVVFRLWPTVLIAVGVDILVGRRSVWGGMLALALIAAVFAGGVWLLGLRVRAGWPVTGEEFIQPLDGVASAEVVVEPGAGSLHVGVLRRGSPNLVVFGRGGGGEVLRDLAVAGGEARLVLRRAGDSFFGVGDDRWLWSLKLSPDVPLQLVVELGAGDAVIDLTGLAVSGLDVSIGVGRAVVTLPAKGNFDARLEGAVGETVVVVPAGAAVRVEADAGLAVSRMPEGYRCQEDVCTSPSYESTEEHVNLEVSQAVGSISVREEAGD